MTCHFRSDALCDGWHQCSSPRTHHPYDLVRIDGSCSGCRWANEAIEPREVYQLTPETCEAYEASKKPPPPGAGTYLTRFFASVYITGDETCGCKELARKMDRRGPDWCEENIDTIVDKLRENAHARGLPFSAWLARALVRRAIRYARERNENRASSK